MESAFRQGDLTDPDLRLIETLGWDGTTFPRIGLHMARLAGAAARLGWPCEPPQVVRALQGAAPAFPARMRLTLGASGHVEVQTAPLPAASRFWSVSLATQRLDPDDPWLTLKSTRRAVYDGARATLPPGTDEVILANDRGEVCDGTITTVFFDAGRGLCTPPLTAGLLPGVLRAEMLASGQCREAGLMASDLPHVCLWVGNSLRGLIPARWSDP